MEIKTRLTLKHHDGRYLSWNPDRYPLSPRIADARRFYSVEDVAFFLAESSYRPDEVGLSASDFEICEIEIEYREKVNNDV
jgi:hypothetical protein